MLYPLDLQFIKLAIALQYSRIVEEIHSIADISFHTPKYFYFNSYYARVFAESVAIVNAKARMWPLMQVTCLCIV